MLTPFGIHVRKLRLEKGLRLLDMAEAMGRTAAFLSAVETGRKPIPQGLEEEIKVALALSDEEHHALTAAADRTRGDVKVGRLNGQSRELVAAFARRVDEMSPETLEEFRKLIFGSLKMAADENPFFRRRRGALVSARKTADMWGIADALRAAFTDDDQVAFPVMDVLEFRLHRLLPHFFIEVQTRSELEGDEARAIPVENKIVFREDVYEAAWSGQGRAIFTAAHEMGHLLLHREVAFARPSDNFPIYRDAEWQADTFAGGLLMPRRHLRRFPNSDSMADACGVTHAAAEVMWDKYRKAGHIR